MRISFSTAGLYPRTSIEALSLLAGTGYKEAELMPQCFFETTTDFAKETKNIDIWVSSIHFPLVFFGILYNGYHGMIPEAKNLAESIAEAGRIMNTEVVVIHPIVMPHDSNPYKDKFTETILGNVRYLCDVCLKAGIKVALENNPNGGRTPQELKSAYELINHENLVYMLDTTESLECSQNPMDFIERTAPNHLHLSDFSSVSKHLPIGEGMIEWEKIFGKLKEKQYNGIYVIEPSYRFYADDMENSLKKVYKRVLDYGK